MKLKKIAKVLLSCVMAGALFTGCGGGDTPAKTDGDKPAAGSSAPIKLGMITPLNTDETTLGELIDKGAEKLGDKDIKHLPKFYDNLNTMQLAVEAGEIEQISTFQSVANYLIASNDKYELVENKNLEKINSVFCFAVRKEDTQLKADLDKVIGEMKSDGSLDKLTKEYVNDVKADNIPKVEIPTIDGAETIKVGVMGDLPPLDLILPDNSPAGFNTALLAEIAKRLNKNIEIVQIDGGARAAALSSKVIDVVFWVIVPLGNDDIPLEHLFLDIDKPEGVELSEPYFKDNVAHLKLKK